MLWGMIFKLPLLMLIVRHWIIIISGKIIGILDKHNTDAESIAANHRPTTPERLYLLTKSFFKYSGKTADINCGSGRDTTWLNNNGYSANGYDASVKISFCSLVYPKVFVSFIKNTLSHRVQTERLLRAPHVFLFQRNRIYILS